MHLLTCHHLLSVTAAGDLMGSENKALIGMDIDHGQQHASASQLARVPTGKNRRLQVLTKKQSD